MANIVNYDTVVKFAKIRPDAIIPTKRDEDAGFDVYANFEEPYRVIEAHKTVMIPTGIALACGSDYCFIAKERGSTGSKGIALRCGVIDSGYRNELFIAVTNTNDFDIIIAKEHMSKYDVFKDIVGKDEGALIWLESGFVEDEVFKELVNESNILLYPYEKAIAQLLVLPVPRVAAVECTYDELKAIPSQRGEGCLGSSGK